MHNARLFWLGPRATDWIVGFDLMELSWSKPLGMKVNRMSSDSSAALQKKGIYEKESYSVSSQTLSCIAYAWFKPIDQAGTQALHTAAIHPSRHHPAISSPGTHTAISLGWKVLQYKTCVYTYVHIYPISKNQDIDMTYLYTMNTAQQDFIQ